ncbi:hypothetical protein AfiDRAFT_0111 [Afipia sp. 1NLS2]|nr:hypothetical protein AfiDRAFT_0111 [Afipia sp. 1NLS2]
MKKLLLAVGFISVMTVPSIAAPQDYSIVPNAPRSASSMDRSRDPAGVTTGSYYEGLRSGRYRHSRAYYRRHHHHHHYRYW